MKTIILTPEQDNLKPLQATVSAKEWRNLEALQYHGGFRRFGMELYDDTSKGKSEMPEVTKWLQQVFTPVEPAAVPAGPTFQQLENFLTQKGINIAGICEQSDVSQIYLNRCRKRGVLPGKKFMDKLLPVIKKYGF